MDLVHHRWKQMSASFQSFIELRKRLNALQRLLRDHVKVKQRGCFPPQDMCKQWMVNLQE